MITVMRKHHKTLMIIITALVCISFSWYWNKTDFAQIGDGTVGKIYDHPVSLVEFQRNSHLLRLASQLGMRELISDLTIGAQSENEMFEKFSWNLIILRHEAKKLGIEPTTSEIAGAVKALPAFQGEHGFDLAAYTRFADHALAPMGFNESQIEELAANQIMLERLKGILRAGVNIQEAEMRKDFEKAYAKMDVSVVRFRPEDFTKDVKIDESEISKYFDAHKEQLKSDEKRKVKFVQFALTGEQKNLKGKERIEVLQKLADQANNFTEALEAKGADFEQVATKLQLTPKETAEFSQGAPDPQFVGTPSLVQAAFALTKEAPNSEAVQTPDGFYVLHLMHVEASRPLTLEEARPKIVEALTKEKAHQMIAQKSAEVAGLLREKMESGMSLAEAATAASVQVEKIPPFSLVDALPGATPAPTPPPKNENTETNYIKQAANSLKPGEISDFVSTPNGGGLLVILEKREALGPAAFEKSRSVLEDEAFQNKTTIAFYEWLRERWQAAGVQEQKAPNKAG